MARSSRLESGFQDKLIKALKETYPGCMVFKMEQYQGLPDLLILYGNRWAALETKRSKTAHHQVNQDYYVNKMNEMSYAKFVNPSNFKEVLDDLANLFKARRTTRVSRSK